MRHSVKGRKLGRTTSHREALFRNQLQSLMDKERIVTTLPKAKELRPLAERVITRGKQGTVHARRWALRWLLRRDLVKKLFDDIAPRFSERPGGYLRIVKLGPRQGDGAEMAVIEMVDRVAPAADKAGKDAAAAGKGKGGAAAGAAKPRSQKAAAKAGAAKKGGAAKPRPQKAAARGGEAEEAAEEKPKKAAKAAKQKPAKPAGRKAAPPPAHGEGGKGGGGGKRPTGPRPAGRKPTTPQKTG